MASRYAQDPRVTCPPMRRKRFASKRRAPQRGPNAAPTPPTPAVALLRLDLGVVISASHNPPEYNGVKFFDREGRKLTDAAEEEIEALFDAPAEAAVRSTASRLPRTATSITCSIASAPT